jgi:hypothetical protein
LAIEQDRAIVIEENGFLGIRQRRDMVNDHIVVFRATMSAAAISGSSSTSSTRNGSDLGVTSLGRTLLLEHCGKVAGHA